MKNHKLFCIYCVIWGALRRGGGVEGEKWHPQTRLTIGDYLILNFYGNLTSHPVYTVNFVDRDDGVHDDDDGSFIAETSC